MTIKNNLLQLATGLVAIFFIFLGCSPSDNGGTSASVWKISTFAGSGSENADNGTGTAAGFNGSAGIAVDSDNNLYVAELYNSLIRKITPAGVVSTFAGSGAGSSDGTGTAASFNGSAGIVVDSDNNLYVADSNNHRIRKITPARMVSTLTGGGSFNLPYGITIDNSGNNLYVTDTFNHRIRRVTLDGVVSTIASNSSGFTYPIGIVMDRGSNLYRVTGGNNRIQKLAPQR